MKKCKVGVELPITEAEEFQAASTSQRPTEYSRGRRWAYYILRRNEENSGMKKNTKIIAIAFATVVIVILLSGSVLLAYFITSAKNDPTSDNSPVDFGLTPSLTTLQIDPNGTFLLNLANIPACLALLPYKTVKLPNYFGHTAIKDVQIVYQKFLAANLFSCSPESELFICAVLLPQANSNKTQPCATYCYEAIGKCRRNFTSTLGRLGLSDSILQCDQFPQLNTNCFYYCDKDEFSCSNGFCVPKMSICDGVNNCGDSSDETVCQTDCNDSSRFRCLNSTICLSRRHICDQHLDCPNGDDERNCRDSGTHK